METQVLLRIEGQVQGVFFRQSTVEMARRHGLKGWVRNCPDGSVEALFEGDRSAILRAIDWCHHGPPAASVTKVIEVWRDFQGEFKDFRIRY